MKKFFQEFGAFIRRGNVIDMAVGVIVGGAFNKIITGITNDIINPLLSLVLGKAQFQDMFVVLKGDGNVYNTLEEAKAAGITVMAYGNIIQLVIDFLLTAFCLFCVIRIINAAHERANKKKAEEAAKAAAEAAAAEAAKEPELTTTEKLLTEIKALLEKK